MTEAQSIVSLALQAVIGIAAAVAAYYGYRNHQVGTTNSAKIDQVKLTTDGTSHTLAANLATAQAKNEDLIRSLAASAVPISPPPEPP
jgi:uncharacterized protein HemX